MFVRSYFLLHENACRAAGFIIFFFFFVMGGRSKLYYPADSGKNVRTCPQELIGRRDSPSLQRRSYCRAKWNITPGPQNSGGLEALGQFENYTSVRICFVRNQISFLFFSLCLFILLTNRLLRILIHKIYSEYFKNKSQNNVTYVRTDFS